MPAKNHLLDESMEELKQWRRLKSSIEDTFCILDAYNPVIYPFLNTLYYLYDFGDDWCIRITCEKRYKRMDEWPEMIRRKRRA